MRTMLLALIPLFSFAGTFATTVASAATWTVVSPVGGDGAALAARAPSGAVYAIPGDRLSLYRTDDRGGHWIRVTLPVPPSPSLPLQIAAAGDGVVPRLPARQRGAVDRRRRHVDVPQAAGHVGAHRPRARLADLRRARPAAARQATTASRPCAGCRTPTSTRSRSIRAAACGPSPAAAARGACATRPTAAPGRGAASHPGAPAGRGGPARRARRHGLRDLRRLPHVPHPRSGPHLDAAHRPRARHRPRLARLRHRAARPPGARSGLTVSRNRGTTWTHPPTGASARRCRWSCRWPATTCWSPPAPASCAPTTADATSRGPTAASATPGRRRSPRPARASR